jgi:hypothetical protein
MPAQSAPPKISATPSLGWFTAIVLGATAFGVGATVFFFDPGTHGFYPACAFHNLTGLNCPGCGATRALYALLHGNFSAAMRDNALFVLALAALAVWVGRFGILKWQHQPASLNVPPTVLWAFLFLAVIFGVARNLPGFEWLSP